MKIILFNVRGVGVKGKKGWVQDIFRTECPGILALQETKSKGLDVFWVEEVWGNRNFGMIQKEARGRSGGLFLVWDKNVFTCN